MTPERRRTLDFIERYFADHRVAPSIRAIAEGTGTRSITSIHNHVKALVASGHLVRTAGRDRNIAPSSLWLRDVPGEVLRAELQRRKGADGQDA